jgi:flagellar basal-body rod protein FlgB
LKTIMIDRLGEQLKVQRNALSVLVQRQEMIASNIANADTPHYKARDIDFKEALANRLAGRREQNLNLAVTARGHLGGRAEPALPASVRYRNEFQPGMDGNTVNMDVERAAFAETALRLEAALTFVRGSFKSIEAALSQ